MGMGDDLNAPDGQDHFLGCGMIVKIIFWGGVRPRVVDWRSPCVPTRWLVPQ